MRGLFQRRKEMQVLDSRDTVIVKEHWGNVPPEYLLSFYGFPPLREYFLECVSKQRMEQTGPADRNWAEKWTIETYLKDRVPVEECLSLCCGFGEIERILADMNTFVHCTAMDLSEGAIQGARKHAEEGGYTNIDYAVTDLNQVKLEPGKYDLIYANGAMHHITNLEGLTAEIFRALKPGGVFVCNEYIGPKFQELPKRQQEMINAVMHLIPRRLRSATEETFIPGFYGRGRVRRQLYVAWKSFTGQIDVKSRRVNPSWPRGKQVIFQIYKAIFGLIPFRRNFRFGRIWEEESKSIKKLDPSECVRSDEIIGVLRQHFSHLDIRPYNGSLLKYALDKKFFEQFDPNSSKDRRLLELLFAIEKTLIDVEEVSSDHAHIIAMKETS